MNEKVNAIIPLLLIDNFINTKLNPKYTIIAQRASPEYSFKKFGNKLPYLLEASPRIIVIIVKIIYRSLFLINVFTFSIIKKRYLHLFFAYSTMNPFKRNIKYPLFIPPYIILPLWYQ